MKLLRGVEVQVKSGILFELLKVLESKLLRKEPSELH